MLIYINGLMSMYKSPFAGMIYIPRDIGYEALGYQDSPESGDGLFYLGLLQVASGCSYYWIHYNTL